MRIVGTDIHRVAAEVVVLHEGRFTKLGRVPMLRKSLEAFATRELTRDDHVVIEATDQCPAHRGQHRQAAGAAAARRLKRSKPK